MNEFKPKSVMIGYVHNGKVDEVFMRSVLRVMMYDQGTEGPHVIHSLMGSRGLYVADNRNGVVRKMLSEPEVEWLWSVDTDIEVEPEALATLLSVADTDRHRIVSGLYYVHMSDELRNVPFRVAPAWYTLRPEGDYRDALEIHAGLNRLDAIGMGCALIHRSVFEAFLKEPKYQKRNKVWFDHDEAEMDGEVRFIGEDMTFCRRVKELGIDIWGLGSVQCNHYKVRKENMQSYLAQFPPEAIVNGAGHDVA